MAFNTKNIIVGAAAVYISKIDSTNASFYPSGQKAGVPLPTLTTNVTAVTPLEADTTNWRGMGYTSDGVEVSNEPDYGEVQVDQLLDSAKIFKQGMRMTINTTLAEASLENLLVAWGQPASTLSGTTLTLSAGALGDDPVERSLAFVGGAPRTAAGGKQERVYYVRRALQVETSAFSLSRADATMFPVSFRLLPEATASGADYGVLIERAIT
jgi:hypothetical protein